MSKKAERMQYREEKTFTIQIHLRASFEEDYEGDDDGYAWFERWKRSVLPGLVSELFSGLRKDASWRVLPTSRGRDRDEALEISVEWTPEAVS